MLNTPHELRPNIESGTQICPIFLNGVTTNVLACETTESECLFIPIGSDKRAFPLWPILEGKMMYTRHRGQLSDLASSAVKSKTVVERRWHSGRPPSHPHTLSVVASSSVVFVVIFLHLVFPFHPADVGNGQVGFSHLITSTAASRGPGITTFGNFGHRFLRRLLQPYTWGKTPRVRVTTITKSTANHDGWISG